LLSGPFSNSVCISFITHVVPQYSNGCSFQVTFHNLLIYNSFYNNLKHQLALLTFNTQKLCMSQRALD